MPAISTTRRNCISPQRPRTVGVRSARTRLVVSARSCVWLRPIASSSEEISAPVSMRFFSTSPSFKSTCCSTSRMGVTSSSKACWVREISVAASLSGPTCAPTPASGTLRCCLRAAPASDWKLSRNCACAWSSRASCLGTSCSRCVISVLTRASSSLSTEPSMRDRSRSSRDRVSSFCTSLNRRVVWWKSACAALTVAC